MNPVHSSLAPFFAVLAHFHAMMKPPKRETPPLYPRAPVSQRNCVSALSNEEPERTGSMRRPTCELFHQTIVEPHQLRVIVVFEHKLPGAHFCFLA